MSDLSHELHRMVTIRATRETVFRYFTDSGRFAAWWGVGSRIDPRVGGEVYIRYPNGIVAAGAVVEIEAPHRVVFTYGYASGEPIGAGASLVTVVLDESPEGTRVHLRHLFADAATRDRHVQGWRYQLAVFANVVARDQHAGVEALVDRFLACWSEEDGEARAAALAEVALSEVVFRDEWAAIAGLDELAAHIGAAQHHMQGMTLKRLGAVRHCQGTALADWVVSGPDGAVGGQGTNVFDLSPDGRVARVVGLWAAQGLDV